MPRILYNEGRVVGYSAYEEYVRQALQQDPDSTPATEKEWLASTISIGSSMLLHIQPDAENSLTRDFKLPETSRLFAANTIIGSFFEGIGHNSADSPWCDYVESYGNLITNTSAAHPITDATTYPSTEDSDEYKQKVDNQIKQYLKIKDGVVIKEGTWETSTKTLPAEVLTSTNNNPPIVRLSFESKIDTDFYILLSGFTDKAVIKGVTNIENQTETQSPQNGDFLGPAVFPWANKIIFTLSSRQDEIIKSNTLGDIKAGIGIDIDKNNDGSITINNSAPNWDSARYVQMQDAATNTKGQFYTYVFNGWKTPFQQSFEQNKDFLNNFKYLNNTIPIQLNTSYDSEGEIVSASIKFANPQVFNAVVDIFKDNKVGTPTVIRNIGAKIYNQKLVNLHGYVFGDTSQYPSPTGTGIVFLHNRKLFENYSFEDTKSNKYYPYQSVIFGIKFKDTLEYNTKEEIEAVKIHNMLKQYAISGNNSSKTDNRPIQKYGIVSDFGYTNIMNVTAGVITYNVNTANNYDMSTNEVYLGDETGTLDEANPLGNMVSTELKGGKIYGSSWVPSYGIVVITEKLLKDAREADDKQFYNKIICVGKTTQQLAEGDLLLVAYSYADGYNQQLYIPKYESQYKDMLNTEPAGVYTTGLNLKGTFTIQKL